MEQDTRTELADQAHAAQPQVFQHSAEISELATALAAAQSEMGSARKTSENPYFRSSYADLAEIMAACRSELAAQGIAVLQGPGTVGDPTGERLTVAVSTRLVHSSGQWIESTLHGTTENRAQAIGSLLTYLRRYGLQAMVGLAAEDDDGNQAQARRTENSAMRAAEKSTDDQLRERRARMDEMLLTIVGGSADDARELLREITCTDNFAGFDCTSAMREGWQFDNARERLRGHPRYKAWRQIEGTRQAVLQHADSSA